MGIKYFREYYTSSPDEGLMDEFKKWVGDKLGLSITNYIGGGVEGEIYEIDKHRVIKFGYNNVNSSQYLSSRNLKGVMKIFQTGVVIAPRKFKAGYGHNDYSYNGIDLLNPERVDGLNDYEIGYTIMERLYPSKELEMKLVTINSHMWHKFIKMDWVDKGGGHQERVFLENDYSSETNAIIKKSVDGFGVQLLKTMFSNINSNAFISDLKQFISDMETGHVIKYTREEIKFDDDFKNELVSLIDELLVIAKNLKDIDMDWSDVHPQQFAYNAKGELTAFDIDFGMGQFDRDKGEFIYTKSHNNMIKKKTKNIIREFSKFNK
jgi:hypothetical protein